jgi:hypothetical protein
MSCQLHAPANLSGGKRHRYPLKSFEEERNLCPCRELNSSVVRPSFDLYTDRAIPTQFLPE